LQAPRVGIAFRANAPVLADSLVAMVFQLPAGELRIRLEKAHE